VKMKRNKAKPIIDKFITSRKWHVAPMPFPALPVVRIDDMLLAGFSSEPDFFNDIAAAVHQHDFSEGFKDEEPAAETLEERIPFEIETRNQTVAIPAHVIFHDGQFWVCGTRVL
jgi:hypothetical protein